MYRKVYAPQHHKSDMTGFVPQYIIIMEQYLQRPIGDGEHIHHKNFDKTDDAIPNLWILSHQEHMRIPEMQAKFLFARGLYTEFEEWFEAHKNDPPDELSALRAQFNKNEVKQIRLQRRLDKQEGLPNANLDDDAAGAENGE